MKKISFAFFLIVLIVAAAAPTFAAYYSSDFTLKNESQCVGGTLVLEYSDVSDTGANVAAKAQAVADCQWLFTGPGQCCDVDYRRGTPSPPAIGSHVWMYRIFEGATVQTETSPLGTLNSYYQRWAGIGGGGTGGGQCTGAYALQSTSNESTVLSDTACPIHNANFYSTIPVCPSNPNGAACDSGTCKVIEYGKTETEQCDVRVQIYQCQNGAGQPLGTSCTEPEPTACTPEAHNDRWYTGTFNTSNAFNERLNVNYDCALWAQSEGFTYWNQSTIFRAGEFDPYDVVCTGLTGSPTGNVSKPRVDNIPSPAFGDGYHEFRSGKVCPGVVPPTASIVANPGSIIRGEQSMLTWSSTNASSCSGTNFNTGGATSGSILVSPSSTTQYSVSCTGTGGTGVANATVTVTDPATPPTGITVSCRADPTSARIGQDVFWSSTVSGPQGLYYYSWSGTDGLSGNADNVVKQYSSVGLKSGWLTVTFKPQATHQSSPTDGSGTGGASNNQPTSCSQSVSDPSAWTGIDCMAGESTFGLTCPAGQMISCDANERTISCNQGAGKGHNLYTDTGNLCRCAPNPSCTQGGTSGGTGSGGDTLITLPPLTACPAIGWSQPVTPCDGSWAPTYSTGGCQSGWQCVSGSGGGSGFLLEQDSTFLNSLQNLLNFESPTINRVPEIQRVDGEVLSANAMTIAHTEGELFTSQPTVKQDMLQNGGVSFTETTFVGRTFSADQATMDRVCTVLHGSGSIATQIGARGYSSCKNNQNFQYSGGRWSVVSGCSYAHLSGSFSCIAPAPAPTPGSCTLSVTPSTVQAGQSAVLSWVSNGLSSLTISNSIGAVSPVTSGSRTVTPTQTITYTGTGSSSGSSTNYTVQSAHQSIIAEMTQDTAPFGIAYNTSYGIYADKITTSRLCELAFGAGATSENYDVTAFNSCGNNQILKWDGSRWSAFGACADNRKILRVLDCRVPAVSTAPSVQCVGNATLTVIPAGGSCPAGQTSSPKLTNLSGAVHCEGGTVIARYNDTLDGASYGGNLQDILLQALGDPSSFNSAVSEIPEGACAELSFKSGNSSYGSYPPNSMLSVVIRDGGTLVDGDGGMFGNQSTCNSAAWPYMYTCGSMAGYVSSQCTGGGGGGGGGGTITKTVQCDNSVNIRTAQCSDGIDNDGDGPIDHPNDPGCQNPQDEDESNTGSPQCSDGIDNDGDGVRDQNDSGCSGPGGYNPNDDDEGGNNSPQCSDGIDNDGDGNVDYPDDLGCSSANDNDEASDAGTINLNVTPSLIKKGQSCTLTVAASSVSSCSLSGPGVSRTFTPTGGSVNVSVTTPALSLTSKYTLSCVGLDGRTVSKTADCRIAPSFEEF